MAKEVYIISGLGADERAFAYLDFSGYSVTYLQWMVPHQKETIEEYAHRLALQIKTPNPVLIGLSFGGMMAVEIAKQIPTEKVILISSAKTKHEIPWYYRLLGKLKVYRIVPARLLKQPNIFLDWAFGALSSSHRKLLKSMLTDTHPRFLHWAIVQVICWKNTTVPGNVYHIHGTKDWILPGRYVHCNLQIKDGGHLMVLNKAAQMSAVLRKLLE